MTCLHLLAAEVLERKANNKVLAFPFCLLYQRIVAFQIIAVGKLIAFEVLETLYSLLPFCLDVGFGRNHNYKMGFHSLCATHGGNGFSESHYSIHEQMGSTMVLSFYKPFDYRFLVRTQYYGFFTSFVMEVNRHSAILHRIELVTSIFIRCTLSDVLNGFVHIICCRIFEELVGVIRDIRKGCFFKTFASLLADDVFVNRKVTEVFITSGCWFIVSLL